MISDPYNDLQDNEKQKRGGISSLSNWLVYNFTYLAIAAVIVFGAIVIAILNDSQNEKELEIQSSIPPDCQTPIYEA